MIFIHGRVPSKKNSKIMVCRGKFPMLLPSVRYKEWHVDASLQLKRHKKIHSDSLTLTFFFPDNRRSDLTNKAESVMDLLVDNHLIEDDSWEHVKKLTLVFGGVEKKRPGVEISW